ncbi:MAG: hypothetical protein WBB25_17905 [Sulfitobacter sp.]
MNQIINMIIRQVMGQLINRGVRAGFDQAAKVGERRKKPQGDMADVPQPEMTPEERRAHRAARQQAKQAKQSMKTIRRMSKF